MGSTQTKINSIDKDSNSISKKKQYILLDKDLEDTNSIFTGHKPSTAAKKVATRGHKLIRLRQKGTKRVHIYRGKYKFQKKTKSHPKWLKDEIKIGQVTKIQMIFLDEYRKTIKKATRSGKHY